MPNDPKATEQGEPKQPTAAELIRKLSPEKQALLAQRLREKRQQSGPRQTDFRRPRSPGVNTFPLSFAQERLWILDQLTTLNSPSGQAENLAYNTNMAFRLRGLLDRDILERSFNEVVRRHEVLRTTFNLVDGQALQTIAPALTIPLLEKDLESLPHPEREPEAHRLAEAEARRPINLSHGPLLRTTLLRLDETDHVLLLTVHHIVSDEWSMWILVWEMVTLYRAFLAGESSPLAELPAQYADFAVWQREWLQGEILEKQLAFWKQRLAGAPPVLDLPTDHPRSALQTSRGAEQYFMLPKPLTEAIKTLGQAQGATLFMTLLAIFKVLLYRYTGQVDMLVGSPMVDRNRVETEGLIGFFLNTLVLRTDLSGNPTFRELLKRVQTTAVETFAHRHLPFEKLVAELHPVRDTSRSPIFQVMFNFLNVPREMINVPGLSLESFGESHVKAQFDLTLSIVEAQLGLRGSFIYNADLFEADTISRMMGHFQTLAESIAANPDRPISDLPLMTDAERHQLLSAWNATGLSFPLEKSIHQLFEAQAQRTPDAIALVFEDRQLTYRELNQRANQMARYLQKLGVGPETLVGVCVERSPEMVVGLLGILKAGGAYVPLDPTYPPERLAFMLSDSGISVLWTQENLLAGLPAGNARLVLDGAWSVIGQEPVENLPAVGALENLAYVIYTSGSTGRPKGVQISHAALVNFLEAMRQRPGLTATDTLLSVTTLSFDIAGLELYLPLTTGASLVLVSREVATDGIALLHSLQTSGATVMQATPATWRMLISAGWQGTPSLKILCGGEALPAELARQLLERGASLWNLYGPTETTVWSTLAQVDAVDEPLSIGWPIANTQVYILDSNLNPVPVGVPGELYIGGDGLARGYLGRPELTAEKFVPNPFVAAEAVTVDGGPRTVEREQVSNDHGLPSTVHGRLYRTGDLARYRSNGDIEYLGRIDYQVKIHGFRIELGEIETALRQFPQVRESVVVARDDNGADKRLVAYLVVQSAAPVLQDLRNFLKSRLPEYMLPAVFVFLEELPLTPNGKVDRKALPAPDGARPASASLWVAPRTLAEEQLARIWADVLRLKLVGVHDDFFELGGDSLLGLQMIALARQAGLHLTPRQIFQYPTIAELAAADPASGIQAEQGLVTGLLPLTPNQRWFLELGLPHPEHWLLSFEAEALVPLSPEWLKQAIQILLIHHDALRTRFVRTADNWQQRIVEPDETTPFMHINLGTLPPLEQDAAMQMTARRLQNSFSLAEGPLVQIVHFDLGENRSQRLLFIVHHLVSDGYSLQVLADDFQAVYRAISQDQVAKLPPKTTSYKTWAEKLSAYAQSEDLLHELDYWLSLPWHRIVYAPLDAADESGNTMASTRTQSVSLTKEETSALLKDYPSGLQDVLLTAFAQTLKNWTKSPCVLFLLIINGREPIFEDVDLSRTVGHFALGYPVLLDMTDAQTPEGRLATVKEQLARIPNRGITHGILHLNEREDVKRKVKKLDEDSYRRKVVFNFIPPAGRALPDDAVFRPVPTTVDLTEDPQNKRDYVLKCTASILQHRLVFNWEYSTNLHHPKTIKAIAEFYLSALRALLGSFA